jgi:hypothetical protein
MALFTTYLGGDVGRVFSIHKGDEKYLQNLAKKPDGGVHVQGALWIWENNIEVEV